MKIQTIIYPLCMAALLGSCHIYKPYSRPEVDTQGLYRDPVSVNDTLVSDTVNMANLPWELVPARFSKLGIGSFRKDSKYKTGGESSLITE